MNGLELIAKYRDRFKMPPYQHQVEDSASIVDHEFFGLLSEMGTGKTKTAVDAACVLKAEGLIDLVVILCPASVRGVWVNAEYGEVRKHAWVPSFVMEYHTPARKVWSDEAPEFDWLVTNYEYLRREDHLEALMTLLGDKRYLLIADESSYIKSRKAVQTKAAIALGQSARRAVKLINGRRQVRRLILNGTPISKNPLDLWSQMRFLDPSILPYVNFPSFRAEFATLDTRVTSFPKIIGWRNLDRLQEHIAPHVVRRLKDDCLDLPKKIYLPPREVPMSEATWQVYKEMRDESVVWLEENPSLAAQAGIRVMRLCQITAGFLGGFLPLDGEEEALTPREVEEASRAKEIGREKLDSVRGWVTSMLEEHDRAKIILWCRFRPELERMALDLADILPTFKVYGQQSKASREEAVDRFSKVRESEAAALIGQVQAGGIGLNLIAAHLVGYPTNTTLGYRLQSEDRVHRPGQTKNVLYQDFIATGPKGQRTVDHIMMASLRSNLDVATWTCSAWRKMLMEE